MLQLIEAIKSSIEKEEYIAAVVMAVTIPDICGKREYGGDRRHYKRWFEAYMPSVYAGHVSGSDAYAIRCALLHSYSGNTAEHRVHEVLEKYHFTFDGSHLFSTRNIEVIGGDSANTTIISAKQYATDIVTAFDSYISRTGPPSSQELGLPLFSNHGNLNGIVGF